MNNFIKDFANTPNPITKFFYKIDRVKLNGDDREKIEWLEAMKKVSLYVENISISLNNAEELENLTNPNLHNTPISNLWLELKNCNFSSKTIENLKTIYPNLITLKQSCWFGDGTGNFTKLLSNLDLTSLETGFYDLFKLKLEFSNVILKVAESNEECLYIRAKSVEIRCRDEEFCWIK